MMAGGVIVDHLAKRDLRCHLWLPSLAIAASLPFYTLYFLVPDFGLAIASVRWRCFSSGSTALLSKPQ